MNEKVESVLNALIYTYLKLNRPVSSSTLKNEANLPYSASTIRNYLQALEKEGLAKKEHASSGSKPSVKAMVDFWEAVLPKKLESIDIDSLQNKCIELDIFAYIKMFDNQMLVNVHNYKDRYIILEFENDEVVFKYNDNLYLFMTNLTGLYLNDIKHIFEKYKLDNIKKIDNLYEYASFNQKILYNYCNEFDLSDFNIIKQLHSSKNSFLKSGAMCYRLDAKAQDKCVEAVFVADVYSDFLDLISSIKGGENGKKA